MADNFFSDTLEFECDIINDPIVCYYEEIMHVGCENVVPWVFCYE